MHVLIAADGALSLEDVDNLKGFSIVEADADSKLGKAALALSQIGEPGEDNHYWLSAEAVIALCPRKDDSKWIEGFWAMLKKVEGYGFSDMENKKVKAHVR